MNLATDLKNRLPPEIRQALYDVRGAVRSVAYHGDRVVCPLCGGHFSQFRSYRGRLGAECPRCGSLERHRDAITVWREHTNLFCDSLRVLHIAPEVSLLPILRSASNLVYVTGDLTPGRADKVVDLTNVEESDGSYDVVLASHVLEHIPDDMAALAEIRRIMKHDGWAYLGIPTFDDLDEIYEDWDITSPAGRQAAFGQWDHVRRYNSRGFEARLALAGLTYDRYNSGWICRA